MIKSVLAALPGCALVLSVQAAAKEDSSPSIELGNGTKNWIVVDDLTRETDSKAYTEVRTSEAGEYVRRGDGVTLTFSEVQIEGDGWLVMHPFINGQPSGTHIAGYAFVSDGSNSDVKITLNPAPTSGENYIVMLHSDADEDRVFDFVFVAENVVEDKAVFEGNRMIAHVVTVP